MPAEPSCGRGGGHVFIPDALGKQILVLLGRLEVARTDAYHLAVAVEEAFLSTRNLPGP